MVFRVLGFFGTNRRESRGIRGVSLAATREIGRIRGIEFLKYHGFDIEFVGARKVGQILFGCRACLHTHRCTLELFRTFDICLGRYQEALTVVIGNCGLMQA